MATQYCVPVGEGSGVATQDIVPYREWQTCHAWVMYTHTLTPSEIVFFPRLSSNVLLICNGSVQCPCNSV